MKNKKAQYQPRESYSSLSPVFILGIVIFIIPFVMPVFGINSLPTLIKSICYGVGILTILIGAALSIFNASN